MQGKAFIKFVDVWKYADAANNVPIQLIPTQVLVTADGKPFVPSDELAEKMEFIMYNSKDTREHVFTVHQGGITEEQMRMILMLCYSLGHSFLMIIAGTSIGFAQKLNASEKYGKYSKQLKIIMGAAILLIAFYMFSLGF